MIKTDRVNRIDLMSEDQTPLSKLVREKLAELHVKQTEFCRLTGFDQGLLSKIQNSVVTTLSLESALKLAAGLKVKPKMLLELIGRPELNDLVLKAYGSDLPACSRPETEQKADDNRGNDIGSIAGSPELFPLRT